VQIFRKYFEQQQGSESQGLGVRISTLGHSVHAANLPYPDARHPADYVFSWEQGRSLHEYQILYIANGAGVFEAKDQEPVQIEAGTILLLYPEIWHRYKPNLASGWEEYWIGFSGAYAKFLLEQECFSSKNPVLKIGHNAEFLQVFSKMIQTAQSQDAQHYKLFSFLLMQLLGIVYTSALAERNSFSRKELIVKNVRDLLDQDWQQKHSFEDIAHKHHVSYVWLRKSFKELTGESLNQYLIERKLQKAREMVEESTESLAQIAFSCGFESEFYFSRLFKQKMGVVPSSLRKKKIHL
jgi:AraC-like DNA-binding protein